MAVLRESQVRNAANRAKQRSGRTSERLLKEQADPRQKSYDIFLSHAVRDADIVIGAKQLLEDVGYSVYVDWIEDPELDRTTVNKETARTLRARMSQCKSLLYLHTRNSPNSKWMPWELGYFDGHNGNVAVLPVASDDGPEKFPKQEYLGLYDYVDFATVQDSGRNEAWVNKRGTERYKPLKDWQRGAGTWRPTTFRL